MVSRHKYGAWRLRSGYQSSEVPCCEIVVGRHTRPKRVTAEYVLIHPTIGDYERQVSGFLKLEDPVLRNP